MFAYPTFCGKYNLFFLSSGFPVPAGGIPLKKLCFCSSLIFSWLPHQLHSQQSLSIPCVPGILPSGPQNDILLPMRKLKCEAGKLSAQDYLATSSKS